MNSDSDFLEFANGLSNLEKSRNFNVFAGYSLEPFTKTLKKFNFDQRNESTFCRISVVGTNAKGSITHFLGEYFRIYGFKTGLYTSPHLISPLERIRIGSQSQNFRNILTKELDQLLSEWKSLKAIEDLKSFSFFELFTCASFSFFEKESTEVQIYEAGLGGRLDATKLCDPDVVVLGVIGLDHKEILGNTKEEILEEKLGICTSNTKALFAIEQNEPQLNEKISSWCSQNGIHCNIIAQTQSKDTYLIRNQIFCYQVFQNILKFDFFLKSTNKKINPIFPKHENVSLILNELSFETFEKYMTPPLGRLSVLRHSPLLVFDPAHNPDAFTETLQSLPFLFPYYKFRIYAGLLKDKDGNGVLEILRKARNKSNILNFQFLNEDEFVIPTNCHAKEIISTSEFRSVLQCLDDSFEPILILGSFRLFPIVVDLL